MSHVELQPGFDFQQAGKEVLAIERECLAELDQYINQNFTLACEKMFWCKGKVVVMGMANRDTSGAKWQLPLPAPVLRHFSSILAKPRMAI